MPVFPWGIGFRDARGFLYYVRGYTLASGEAGAQTNAEILFSALTPLSGANAQTTTGCLLSPTSSMQRGSVSDYSDGAIKLVYSWQDAVGVVHRWRLPSPSDALFSADGVTLDASNATVINLAANMAAADICSRAGILYQLTLGGVRERGRQRRRLAIAILNPALTNQG